MIKNNRVVFYSCKSPRENRAELTFSFMFVFKNIKEDLNNVIGHHLHTLCIESPFDYFITAVKFEDMNISSEYNLLCC